MSGVSAGRFMYFAFGSNLLRERLQLANPTATFFCTGRLKVCNFFFVTLAASYNAEAGRERSTYV